MVALRLPGGASDEAASSRWSPCSRWRSARFVAVSDSRSAVRGSDDGCAATARADPVADHAAAARRSPRRPTPDARRALLPALDWQPCETDDDHDCGFLTVPVDYADPQRRDDRPRAAPGAGHAASASARWWSTPAGPAPPGRRTPPRPGRSSASRCSTASTSSASTPAASGRSARSTASATPSSTPTSAGDPDARHAAEERGLRARRDCPSARAASPSSGAARRPRHHVEAARDMDVLRAALGEATLDYFGASYGTKLGATYAELFPEQVGRFVLDGAVDVALDPQTLNLEQAAGLRDRAARLRAELRRPHRQLLPRRHRRRGPGHDHRPARRRSRRSRCPARRPRADRRQRVLRPHRAALQPRLLGPAQHRPCARRWTARARRCCSWPTPTPRAAPTALHRQLHRGQLRHQLPRRPVVGAVRRRAVAVPGVREGLADLRPGLRLGHDQLPRHRR